ncbi:MAG: hypothetical protein AB8I08_06265 [Sandaracinaceae bacterium]
MSGAQENLEVGGTSYTGDAFQWLRMAVTAATPKHVWHAGKGYAADAFDGFTAHTDDHVWLQARGGGSSADGGGTITIQSQGQAWLQSMEGPLSFVAGGNVVFGTGTESKSGFKLGAAGGLTIVADRTITASTVPDSAPEDALSCETNTADVASAWGIWWTSLDTACALGLNAMDRALASALDGSAVPRGAMNWLMTSMGMCANFAGAGANLYGMIGGAAGAPTAPGMTLAGEAGVLIGSKMSVNIWGAPGALLGSAFTTVFGGIATGAIAGVDFGMSSLGTVDMSALVAATMTAVATRTGVGVELAARSGKFKAEAKTNLTTQSATGSIEARATTRLEVESMAWLDLVSAKGAVGLKSGGVSSVNALSQLAMGLLESGQKPGGGKPDDVTPLAPVDAPVMAAPVPGSTQPNIMMTAAGGVAILSGDESSAPLVTIKGDKIEIAVGTSGPTATLNATQVEFKIQQASLAVSASSLKMDGDEVSFS